MPGNPADCDDSNPARSPLKPEVPGNAVDENCDNVVVPYPSMPSRVAPVFDTRKGIKLVSLSVFSSRKGSTLTIRCQGRGCRFGKKSVKITTAKRELRLEKRLTRRQRSFKPRQRLTFTLSGKGWSTRVKVFTMRGQHKFPRSNELHQERAEGRLLTVAAATVLAVLALAPGPEQADRPSTLEVDPAQAGADGRWRGRKETVTRRTSSNNPDAIFIRDGHARLGPATQGPLSSSATRRRVRGMVALMATCSACGPESRAGSRFCSQCGTPLALHARAAAPPTTRETASAARAARRSTARAAADGPGPVAERRLVSVLFADLVGFTTLSEHRDPEEVRELLSRTSTAAAASSSATAGRWRSSSATR